MKGIIFDMDGTMVDNMMIHHHAWKQLMDKLGHPMTLAEVKEQLHGVNTEILYRIFGDKYTPEQYKQISDEKESMYREIFRPQLKLVDGLPELLEELHAANIPMGVGTAASPENVDFVLDTLNIRHYFKAVHHAEDVSRGKPDPEIFILVAAGMGLYAKDCLIFEDSVTGAETAKNAGSEAIVLTTTHEPEEFAHLDHIRSFVKDFTSINLSYLQTEFNLQSIGA